MGEERGEKKRLVAWFSELSNKDVQIAGGKGASLAEMFNSKFPVPPGFVITSDAYAMFLTSSGLDKRIKDRLEKIDVESTEELQKASKDIRKMIEESQMPRELVSEITEAYDFLAPHEQNNAKVSSSALDILRNARELPFVAVRSSATAEDLADASFAGQQDSFLNVKGSESLLVNVKKCMSSLFTARAIYYRTKKGFEHEKVRIAVVVQRMVDSDKSGVMFSKNPVTHADTIMIEGVWGLGEGIVSGMIKPDHFVVRSNEKEFTVLEESTSEKKVAVTRNSSGKNEVIKLSEDKSKQRVLSNYELKRLAQYAIDLEKHYQKPQDIEFAIEQGEIYIVQSRPITTLADKKNELPALEGEVILSGMGASPGIASGKVRIVHDENDLNKVQKGDVLVAVMTNPDMVVGMQKAAAIITDEGGVTSHAAIVSREMGIPAVVGTGKATETLKEGEIVSVDGFRGKVHVGESKTKKVELEKIVSTRTKIRAIVDVPEAAERAAKTGITSVGLVRLEGVIAEMRKHPLGFVKEGKIPEYIEHLVSGLKGIVKHFEEAWIRTSDLRSDEYRMLDGAPQNNEGNPMLGDHGIRFSVKHPEILKAEVMAIKELADEFPNKKFGIMAPQIISVSELQKLKEVAKEVGLPKNVSLGIMVETPAAVEIINELCEEGFDFLSFGTNDLTQYMLAVDRNNPDVQHLVDEMHPAVQHAISYVIRRAKKYGIKTSICGQAASRPEIAEILVKEGIDSLSVNADSARKVSEIIAQIEGNLPAGKEVVVPSAVKVEGAVANVKVENIARVEKKETKEEKAEEVKQVEGLIADKLSTKDIEETILEEIKDWDKPDKAQGDETQGGESYEPGLPTKDADDKGNIPPLHDSPPDEIVDDTPDDVMGIFN